MQSKITADLIKSPADFTELLDLQTLQVQLEVSEKIQKNLYKYQSDFFKSFCKTGKQVLEILPESQHADYYKSFGSNNTYYGDKCKTLFQILTTSEDCYRDIGYRTMLTFNPYSSMYIDAEIKENDNKKIEQDKRSADIANGKLFDDFEWEKLYIIDYTKRALVPVDSTTFDKCCNHEMKFKRKKNILVVEHAFAWKDWYNNTGPTKYRSEFFEFDLSTNMFIKSYNKNNN